MFRLDPNNPNTVIGIILLVVLAVFVLPDRLPRFISDLSPYLFAGIPCGRLPVAKDLAAHQSVIGRAAKDPLLLAVSASDIGDDGSLAVRLTVTNWSLGTVPVVYQQDNITVAGDDDGTNGFGLMIAPLPESGNRERTDPNPSSYDEGDIRLLGPRQKCVHSSEVTASAAMIANGGIARAWYRMTLSGAHPPLTEGAREIYPDQGLAILSEDVVFSEEVAIEARA